MCPAASRQPGTTFCLVRELFRPGAWQLTPVGGAATPQTQTSPPGQSVPGIVDSVVGRRPHTGVRLGRLINQNSHVIRVPELCAAPRKRCNSNDAISMFEIHVGELRATFLRNHNMRRHKGTTKCPQAEDSPSRRQLKPRRRPHPQHHHNCHKHRGTTRDKGHCTRYVAVHPLRGAAPEQKRCIAYGSGAVPQHTRTNAELAHRTTHRHNQPGHRAPSQ